MVLPQVISMITQDKPDTEFEIYYSFSTKSYRSKIVFTINSPPYKRARGF
jgi:hypothetical protein